MTVHSPLTLESVRARRAVSLGAPLLTLLLGCGAYDVGDEPAEAVGQISSAITTTTFQDFSGDVKVRVKVCDQTPTNFTNCAYCPVDAGWARIGGGAFISNQGTGIGLLQASFPTDIDWTTASGNGCLGPVGPTGDFKSLWIARASGGSHKLQAYVVEIQMRDANGVSFMPDTTIGIDNVTSSVNPPANYTVTTFASQGMSWEMILVGGGAYVFQAAGGGGQVNMAVATDAYLVESRPTTSPEPGWVASARARHNPAFDEPLKSFAIGLERCPPRLGKCLSYTYLKQIVGPSTSGFSTTSYAVPTGWLAASPGAFSQTQSSGPSYIGSMVPVTLADNKLGFFAGGKPFSSGTARTFGSTLVFGLEWSTYNRIRFFNNLATLVRPSGTNPQLQRSENFTDTPSRHWYLDPLGGNTFRLRNGNPGSGTECAYRDGATSNVRVTTCGTTSAFRWTLNSDVANLKQLRNASSGTCLDDNGASGADSNVVLKPCVPGGGAAQQLFLDKYSWPVF
jgi:hypothetical protein